MPIPSPVPGQFRTVEALVAVYCVAVFGVTGLIVSLWLPIEWTVPTLAIVAGAFFVPFWSAVRRVAAQ